jgi:hypothetical protein
MTRKTSNWSARPKKNTAHKRKHITGHNGRHQRCFPSEAVLNAPDSPPLPLSSDPPPLRKTYRNQNLPLPLPLPLFLSLAAPPTRTTVATGKTPRRSDMWKCFTWLVDAEKRQIRTRDGYSQIVCKLCARYRELFGFQILFVANCLC